MEFYTNVKHAGNNILYRGYKDGLRIHRRIKFCPTTYLGPHQEDHEYRNVRDGMVIPIHHNSIKDAREWVKKNEDVANRKLYGMTRWNYQYLHSLKNQYNLSLIRILNIDIEVDSDAGFPDIGLAEKEIVSITMEYNGQFYILGLKEYTPHKNNITYIQCKNEIQLIRRFIKIWQEIDADIVTGWYAKYFDIPYIAHRIERLMGESMYRILSPWKIMLGRQFVTHGQRNYEYEIYGMAILDYMDLMKKYEKPLSLYNLNYVGYAVLGDGKLDFTKYGTLSRLYKENHQLFIEYNWKDVDIVRRLNVLKKLIDQVLAIAYDAKVNYEDVLMQVRVWDVIIHNYLLDRKIVVPQINKSEKDHSYAGAYVKEPKIGLHRWVVSFDLTSMYPSLIRQYSIGPDTLIENEHVSINVDDILYETDVFKQAQTRARALGASLAANGHYYRHKKSFMAQLMENMMKDRKQYKGQMFDIARQIEDLRKTDKNHPDIKNLKISRDQLDNLQWAKKIQLNSCYGAIGNQYFRFFDVRNATAITISGQLTIKWIERVINDFLNEHFGTDDFDYVIAEDTDSMYLDLSEEAQRAISLKNFTASKDIVSHLNDFAETTLQPVIDAAFEKLANHMNCFENHMVMKREVIAERGLWQAKKRYALDVWNSEGVQYTARKMKTMGLETVRSSTPKICREKLEEAVKLVLRKDEKSIQQLVKDFRKEFHELPFEEMAFPRSVNGIARYTDKQTLFAKGAPIHVKGSILHNVLIDRYNLLGTYDYIKEGEKVLYCYLKTPNPRTCNAIASIGPLPDEMRLNEYIDRETQFEKAFVKPLQSLLDNVGWETESRPTLF